VSVVDRVKQLLGSEPGAAERTSTDETLAVEISDPGPDTDSCKITLNRDLSPDKTEFFETHAEAADWPMVQKVMRVPGVHSVILKKNVVIVARHASVAWASLLKPIEDAIRTELEPPSQDVSPIDAIANAAAGNGPDEELRTRVQDILDNEINPSVAAHGGYISLLDVQDTRVFLYMGGGCQGCGMAAQTLKHGVETTLRRQIPEISEILDTTDHASGSNPYYQSGF